MQKRAIEKNDILGKAGKLLVSFIVLFAFMQYADANYYIADFSFAVPDSVFSINDTIIPLKGSLSQANYSDNGTLASASTGVNGASINLTIENQTRGFVSNYTLITDSSGNFYSNSSFNRSARTISVPQTIGEYFILASYIDPNSAKWFSELAIKVINQSVDILRISSEKAVYNPSESVTVNIEAVKQLGDKVLYVSNVTVNGSLRNSSLAIISSLNCTTGTTGRCTTNVTAPSTYGQYVLELENYKAFNSFIVVPFSFNIYMKDELGKTRKNVYALNEQGRVEVSIANASNSDIYTFSGYIVDSSGNVVKTIDSTTLNSNNSFANSFLFTVDALTFGYKSYRATVTVTKSGDGSIAASTSFEVQDWDISFNKRTTASGFEYEYSSFPNRTIFFEVYPTFRSNGSVIQGLNYTFFTINTKDSLGNIVGKTNLTWNATCAKEGCYQFSINTSTIPGRYAVSVTLANAGSIQTRTQTINVISGVLTAQSTDKDGIIKELFGTNEGIYISLNTYNNTANQFNLSDAEIFSIRYMNGSEITYTQVNNFTGVNSSNGILEWAWNITSQRLKLDTPKTGGTYTIFIFGDNKTYGTSARVIINPYDVCMSPKDTPGSVTSGYYYVWQFKTSDTIYFEIKITQANNPTGKASALNNSNSGNSTLGGVGSACTIDTATKQVVNNATITIGEVRNTITGSIQNINSTSSSCQASDNSGSYTCTLKPLSKWEGGVNGATFNIKGIDGTVGIASGRFEARAFYLYGYPSSWQNGPSSNISLTIRLYEAGGNWWGGGGSGGLSGSVTLKKVEYMGREGEWVWPPVDSGYNASNISAATVTSGSATITVPVNQTQTGLWKTGYYRAILHATTASGDTDYGYAWFGIKSWDVYGMPIECSTLGCNYKSYFNSRENITFYVKISQAGDYSYNAQAGQSLGGNVTISVKKLQDCRTWPCKELNSSDYVSTSITVNESSPWYWNANNQNQSKYLISINSTKSKWNTGWYSVVLDINGTDTGSAWFNVLSFYTETQPVDRNGSTYRYSIKGNQPMYFNITATKNYKTSFTYNGSSYRYNTSDYVNATIDSMTLRTWDQTTQLSYEYTYPTQVNATFRNASGFFTPNVTGNGLLNVTYLNGSWPSGWYSGEIILRNVDNETATGWLWFSVKPFRVQLSSSTYNVDSDQCINSTVNVYDPDWSSSTILTGNYSIIKVYEQIWSGSGNSFTTYTNFTNSSFNATANVTFCPNNGEWGTGNWGGYHSLNVVVKDNVQNDTEAGWLSFRTTPFQITWGSVQGGTNKATNANITVQVNLSKSTGGSASGNLTNVYQWRYDSSTQYSGTKESYVFKVGNCWSNVSGQCNVTGVQNVTIHPPSGGWKVGYNYLNAEWTKVTDSTSKIEDWSGVYLEGRETYNGYYNNVDTNGNWKYHFNNTENITIKIYVRDSSYSSAPVNITNVQYGFSGQSCYGEWCKSYTSATWGLVGGGVQTAGDGSATLNIKAPSGGWSNGEYGIKASVSGSAGTATITGGTVKIRNASALNITAVTLPANNATYNVTTTALTWNITTNKNAQCSVSAYNYNNFQNYFCSGWNTTDASNGSLTSQTLGACNTTLYSYNGTTYYNEYISDSYKSTYNGTASTWGYGSSGLVTGGTTHRYSFNTTDWPKSQHYGLYMYCYDTDSYSRSSIAAFKVVA